MLSLSGCMDSTKFGDSYKYSFLDRELSGVINDKDWNFQTGLVTEAIHEDDKYLVELYSDNLTDPCDIATEMHGNYVSFYIPMYRGVYVLDFSLFGESQTVSLFDREYDLMFSASKGAIEITELDSINGILSGRIDAYIDTETNINGWFSAKICE